MKTIEQTPFCDEFLKNMKTIEPKETEYTIIKILLFTF